MGWVGGRPWLQILLSEFNVFSSPLAIRTTTHRMESKSPLYPLAYEKMELMVKTEKLSENFSNAFECQLLVSLHMISQMTTISQHSAPFLPITFNFFPFLPINSLSGHCLFLKLLLEEKVPDVAGPSLHLTQRWLLLHTNCHSSSSMRVFRTTIPSNLASPVSLY